MNSRAQIVATIGPASKTRLEEMMRAGMDVARLNFSHGSYEEHSELIRLVREASAKVGKRVPILQDLSGPREKTAEGHQLKQGISHAFTEKDRKDVEFGLSQDVDYIVQSYVANAQDIIELREYMQKLGKVKPIVAKIEREIGVRNIGKILKVSDAIMLGRGDLGLSMPMEQIPFVQHEVVRKCNRAKKPIIIATQMMLSMVENPEPTRAEVSDVAHAIIEGADAVMLSEESAIGKYPIEVVTWMEKIILEAERQIRRTNWHPL